MRRILYAILLPGASEHLIGDLEEEAESQSTLRFLRHILIAATHQASLLETTAATAFLIGIPLLVTIEIRRFALTMIPFRESADFSNVSLLLMTVAIATLSAWETRLLGRRWLPVASAAAITLVITALTNTPTILTAAALVGGSLATLRRRGNIA
jgi:hypothetical protein